MQEGGCCAKGSASRCRGAGVRKEREGARCSDFEAVFCCFCCPFTRAHAATAGDLYANDYAKAVLGATEVKEADGIKKELLQLWTDLSRRLDALSNFHFTPKPIVKVPSHHALLLLLPSTSAAICWCGRACLITELLSERVSLLSS